MRRIITVLVTALLLVCLMVSTAFACECGGKHKSYNNPETNVTMINKAQTYLKQLGYNFTSSAGKISESMRNALRSFQYDSALTTNRKLNDCTMYRLETRANAVKKNRAYKSWVNLYDGNYRLMQRGNAGARVKKLNNTLLALGFGDTAKMRNSTRFSDATYKAVVAFQKQYVKERKADGKAGPYTLSTMERVYGLKNKGKK